MMSVSRAGYTNGGSNGTDITDIRDPKDWTALVEKSKEEALGIVLCLCSGFAIPSLFTDSSQRTTKENAGQFLYATCNINNHGDSLYLKNWRIDDPDAMYRDALIKDGITFKKVVIKTGDDVLSTGSGPNDSWFERLCIYQKWTKKNVWIIVTNGKVVWSAGTSGNKATKPQEIEAEVKAGLDDAMHKHSKDPKRWDTDKPPPAKYEGQPSQTQASKGWMSNPLVWIGVGAVALILVGSLIAACFCCGTDTSGNQMLLQQQQMMPQVCVQQQSMMPQQQMLNMSGMY